MAVSSRAGPPPGGRLATLARALSSWRTASVSLLMFPAGLPLGLVWIAMPVWLTRSGVEIEVVGLFTLAQLPWSLKILWSPLVDRFAPRWPGRKRGWILLAQVALAGSVAALALVGDPGAGIWIVGLLGLAVAFASATQDIALDAYSVEVLRPEEQGVASGARTALYRIAMFVAGSVAITLAGSTSWPLVFVLLALLYLPSIGLTLGAPEPERLPPSPRSFREAVWRPLRDLARRPMALEIAAFLLLYKAGDNLAGALIRPFLAEHGYSDLDVGLATGTVGLVSIAAGAVLGGAVTTVVGLRPALWVFGVLQIVSNLGYVLVAGSEVSSPLLYAAMALESGTQGMGTGAFMALLLRLTDRRFSATQYAIFSSLFALGRTLAGPVAGYLAAWLGWRDFFLATMVAGLPGLALLWRFAPPGGGTPAWEGSEEDEGGAEGTDRAGPS